MKKYEKIEISVKDKIEEIEDEIWLNTFMHMTQSLKDGFLMS